jgi:hypothetical protein
LDTYKEGDVLIIGCSPGYHHRLLAHAYPERNFFIHDIDPYYLYKDCPNLYPLMREDFCQRDWSKCVLISDVYDSSDANDDLMRQNLINSQL